MLQTHFKKAHPPKIASTSHSTVKWRCALILLTTCLTVGFTTGCGSQKPQDPAGFACNSNHIIGGQVLAPRSALTSNTVGVRGKNFICSGTLIARDLVLTAAHCVDRAGMAVEFGASPSCDPNSSAVHVTGVRVSNYNETADTDRNDIALLKLARPAPTGFDPAPIATTDMEGDLKTNSVLIVAGFGQAHTGLPSATPLDGYLRETNVSVWDYQFGQTEFLVYQGDGHGACYGDSGGPAFLLREQKYYLLGVASRGDEECRLNGVYAKVPEFRSWLAQAATSLGSTLP